MDSRESLVRDAARGCTTLILGAGVAGACNVATWRELAQRLWQGAFGTALPPVADDPRFYPFVFEHVQAVMREQFAPRLRAALYEAHELPERRELLHSMTNTLAVLARVIAHEACSARRRLVRVITLNVDDLLERSAFALCQCRGYRPWTNAPWVVGGTW
jgi:NAD-dependent SIR2 family protein deacetylase